MAKLEPVSSQDSDVILAAFLEYVERSGIELYDHQEEAILELFAGNNVILNTPTGSGKSMVALALQYKSLCQGRTSYYTVPIKALANEKFLSLCQTFGPERVGLVTGDATVNGSAPVICCTAEILSNLALREGARAKVDEAIMDEFHYYSDHSRGVAWQIPLLTLPQARFLLMSATLGETKRFQDEIAERTGAPTPLVSSEDRPVPLHFEYSETPLEEKVAELAEEDKAPIYLVHFTQLACARSAQNLLSHNFCSKEEKKEIGAMLGGGDFRSPYGKDLQRFLRHGVGIHHAGLLPKYRVLVEKLAQKGLLKVICGTDTLGVGINVPIRTVVFTQLCKYDGQGTKILSVRDFKQICGRAGRRGFDDQGFVVIQAPEHVIENLRLEQKAQDKPGKKKFVKKKPPERGFVPWDEATLRKLRESPPEKLTSSFVIQPGMLLHVLSREQEDGCSAFQTILAECHEPDEQKATLRKRAFRLFRGLVEGGILTILPTKERMGPVKVKLHGELQEDFSLTHALGLYLIDTIELLDAEDPGYPLQLLSLVEAILENPDVVLRKQVDKIKTDLVAEMKADGVEYDERMARLEEVEYPKPGADFLYQTFQEFCGKNPWVAKENIRPKSIAREMFEEYHLFEDYVKRYGLEKSEGVLLRHLSEVYRVLDQTVPPAAKTEVVLEAERFFEEMIRGVDSSLLDEWETLRNPELAADPAAAKKETEKREVPITRSKTAFARMVRNRVFELVKCLSGKRWEEFAERSGGTQSARAWEDAMADYWEGRERIRLDPEARAKHHSHLREGRDEEAGFWFLDQTLVDPEEWNDWALRVKVDLAASDAAKEPVVEVFGIGPVVE